jgi:hypothetical protein
MRGIVYMHVVRSYFDEDKSLRLYKANVPSSFTFGVELEIFMPSSVCREDVQSAINQGLADWQIKRDRSIVCDPSMPWCYRAELVSPVLSGAAGVEQIYRLLRAVKPLNPGVNKSCGLHVHVSAAGLFDS